MRRVAVGLTVPDQLIGLALKEVGLAGNFEAISEEDRERFYTAISRR
jgi:hypothetical protein